MPNDYHHGDLPAALRSSAAALLAERGPSSFSLREVARRAGVSHAAPSHHFGDSRGLLTAVAAEGYEVLAAEMRSAVDGIDDPYERLRAMGHTYVRTAMAHPGHYSVMVDDDFTDQDDAALQECGGTAYAVLLETVELLRDKLRPDLDVQATAMLLWSSVHGIVELWASLEHVAEKHGGGAAPSLTELVDHHTMLVIDGIRAR